MNVKEIKQGRKRGRRKYLKTCKGCGGRSVYKLCDPCYQKKKDKLPGGGS